ncbi:MAG: glycoside hydrolase family 95 protein, partial [Prevotellaceae bacterium]|nr:glycoside hydrolase family 95 protein [Prevotellaceae bacterium]
MKKILFTFLLLCTSIVLYSCSQDSSVTVNQVRMNWWYDVPATKYWESLPIGTGRFGAMIPGAVDNEVIAFNDETLWTGGPYNPNNPDGPAIMQKIRKAAFAHDWVEAEKQSWLLASSPQSVQYYQPMGRLNINIGHSLNKATNYSRSLSMDSALVDIHYQLDGVNYSRRVFASYPDQVIVLRFTADKKGKINLANHFTSHQSSAVTRIENNEIIMEGTTISEKPGEVILPPQMKWQSRLKIITEGGALSADGN